jgi:peptidoglycan/LPS O-acetylase OafA/YrhL
LRNGRGEQGINCLIFISKKNRLIKNERIIGLDILRAISILMVVFAHSFHILTPLTKLGYFSAITQEPDNKLMNLGILGVELFFVLSGFLIGGILMRLAIEEEHFSLKVISQFWKRRWMRTLPNYWLFLTISIMVYHLMNRCPFEAKYLQAYIFTQNFLHPNTCCPYPEGWSLSIEEWFYFSLPVVMYLSFRIFKRTSKKKHLLIIFLSYLVVFFLIRFINAFDPINGPDPDEGIRKVVVFRLDAVMYGVIIAYFTKFYPAALHRIRKGLFAISILGTASIFYLLARYNFAFRAPSVYPVRVLTNGFLYFFLPLFLSFSLPFVAGARDIKNRAARKAITHISKISYSMYLTHYSLLLLALFLPMAHGKTPEIVLCYVGYWITVLALASLAYKFFELPIMKLRDRPAHPAKVKN